MQENALRIETIEDAALTKVSNLHYSLRMLVSRGMVSLRTLTLLWLAS